VTRRRWLPGRPGYRNDRETWLRLTAEAVGVGVGAGELCRKAFQKTEKQGPNLDRSDGLNEDPRMELMVDK